VAESVRWGDYRRDVHPLNDGQAKPALYTRESHWLREIERVANSYFPKRNGIVLSQLRAARLYPTVEAPTFSQQGGEVKEGFALALAAAAGKIYYTTNGADPRRAPTGEIAESAIPYSGKALPITDTVLMKARVLHGQKWSALNEAVFAVGSTGEPVRVTQIMYHPKGGDAYEFLRLMNVSDLSLDLTQYRFRGIDYIFPENSVLRPGATLLLASSADTNAFKVRYPAVTVSGNFAGRLNNAGERISILDRRGRTVTSITYDDKNGWPAAADGAGAFLEMIDPRADANDPKNWRATEAGLER
jgi:hypothetical protein